MNSDIHGKKHSFREFRSPVACMVAAIYCCFSLCISAYAIWGNNDGGVWFFMLIFYFPFSILDVLVQVLVQLFFGVNVIKWLPAFDLFMFVVGGTFWYYMLSKAIAFRWAKRKFSNL